MVKYPHATIGELCRIEKGETGLSSATPGEYPLVATSAERKSCCSFQFDTEAVCIPLVSSTGHGKKTLNYVHFQKGKFALGTILAAVIPKEPKKLSAAFLHRYLQFYKDRKIVPLMKGAANVSLAVKDIAKIEVPVPPINEQKTFIELFNKLNDSSIKLQGEFSNQSVHLSLLRQSILQEAVEGKLTADWRKKHPELISGENHASALLDKIKAKKDRLIKEGKIKKEKPLPPIKEEKKPFELPAGWVWCRLGEACFKITDGFHNTPPKLRSGRPYISATHVKSEMIDWDNCDFVAENYHQELWSKAYPQKGEILIVNIGAGCGTPAIITADYEFSFKNTAILKFTQEHLSNKYFLFLLLSVKEDNYINLTQGGLQPFLSLKILQNILLPLPPRAEQQAIVERVDKIMAMIDELAKQVSARKERAEMLMQSVLREAFESA